MYNPRDVVPESIMPAYPWLAENELDGDIQAPRWQPCARWVHLTPTTRSRRAATLEGKTELDALIAYLQGLGIELQDEEMTMTFTLLQIALVHRGDDHLHRHRVLGL